MQVCLRTLLQSCKQQTRQQVSRLQAAVRHFLLPAGSIRGPGVPVLACEMGELLLLMNQMGCSHI